jgi:hypothetical protein
VAVVESGAPVKPLLRGWMHLVCFDMSHGVMARQQPPGGAKEAIDMSCVLFRPDCKPE